MLIELVTILYPLSWLLGVTTIMLLLYQVDAIVRRLMFFVCVPQNIPQMHTISPYTIKSLPTTKLDGYILKSTILFNMSNYRSWS